MTDDQVQRIVDALRPEWWEPWLSATVTLLAVLAGWGLATMSERRARSQRRRDDEAAALDLVVRRAGIVLGQLATSPDELRLDQLKATQLASPEVVHDLNRFDSTGLVAGWWLRQATRLIEMEPPRGVPKGYPLHPSLKMATTIMTGVDARLQGWARGEVPVEDFEQRFDAEWDAAIQRR